MKLQEWRLKNSNKNVDVKASVPGDITWDLFEAGLVKDPFFGLNHKELFWVWEEDFEYETTFYFDGALEDEDVLLTFDGIDTFAEIYVNETLVGKTENMFLAYEYEIKDFLKRGENKLLVRMCSTLQKMQKINSNGYFGVFNEKRLFIRKAQCHFGWDWAPDMPGYGIYRDVSLKKVSKSRLKDVHREVKEKTEEIATREDLIIEILKENQNITIQELADKIGKLLRTVKTSIKVLQERGKIERVGGKKDGSWRVL